jgi:hypothetical protein
VRGGVCFVSCCPCARSAAQCQLFPLLSGVRAVPTPMCSVCPAFAPAGMRPHARALPVCLPRPSRQRTPHSRARALPSAAPRIAFAAPAGPRRAPQHFDRRLAAGAPPFPDRTAFASFLPCADKRTACMQEAPRSSILPRLRRAAANVRAADTVRALPPQALRPAAPAPLPLASLAHSHAPARARQHEGTETRAPRAAHRTLQ